jgi:hypothetical protein
MKACRQLRELDTAVALLEHHLNFQRPELICINAFLSVCSEVRLTTSQAHSSHLTGLPPVQTPHAFTLLHR